MGDAGISNGPSLEEVQQKYDQERDKRMRADGNAQFETLLSSQNESFVRFAADPWDAELTELQRTRGVRETLANGTHTRILILGAGYGGLYFAVRLLEAGFSVDDLLIVDTAGGFGGTWYWNRYPGLMCDVESYIYMPMLEKMGYMPKHKYAFGEELRNYANAIAEKFELHRAAAFKVKVNSMKWDDEKKSWAVDVTQDRPTEGRVPLNVDADFVILASGLLNEPKMPKLPGVDKFQGHSFHTSRWDYDYTGGSPADPSLTRLRDKRVGIIGTGATAIQAVPQLAKWAKELYVFQRTPSAVDRRDNCETDPEWWAQKVTSRGRGWQTERMENYNNQISDFKAPSESDMVSDGWTKLSSYCVLVGGPHNLEPDFISKAREMDLPRQERVRGRVEEIVKDPKTAKSLQAWYATWCKRPCFHDEYLPAFNEPHVSLVDTDGKGVSHLTETGIVDRNSHEYPVDTIIFSTGFTLKGGADPGSRAGVHVAGRGGEDMDHKWTVRGCGTLHGCVSRDFPNLFFPGPTQAGVGPNQSYTLDVLSTHIAYIISQTAQRAAENGQKNVSVEPSADAEEAWAEQIVKRARAMAAVAGCTPSYLNGEGAAGDPTASLDDMKKRARMGTWGAGINDFVRVVTAWRDKGDMEGLEVRY